MQFWNGSGLNRGRRLEQRIMVRLKQVLALVLVWGVVFVTLPANATSGTGMYLPPQDAPSAPIPASQIDALVAPIALYPDALVAQILAASTYPNEVVEADQWLKDHNNLQGSALAEAVNQQSWDPSVQALTQFPSTTWRTTCRGLLRWATRSTTSRPMLWLPSKDFASKPRRQET
jgi:hypothetical protein